MYFSTSLPLLPAVLLPLAWLAVYGCVRRRARSRLEACLLASLGWGLLLWLVSELQSLSGTLSFRGAVGWWALAAAALEGSRRLVDRRWPPADRSPAPPRPTLSASEWATVAAMVLVVAAVGVIAWLSPVTAWDALAYHLPRVFYWAQYGSIEHFPTANDRNLFMAPWPAFAQLQLYLLAGSDRLANLPQWLCLLGSAVAAAAVAGNLGARRPAQILAALLVATLPMGILQASTALTDWTAAFWLIVLAYFAFTPTRAPVATVDLIAAGAALGLALLSKGSALPVAVPLAVAVAAAAVRRLGSRAWRPLTVVVVLAVGINTPHAARNYAAYGHPTAPPVHRSLVLNESLQARYVVSNLARQSLVHLGSWNPEHARGLVAVSDALHRLLGVDDGDPVNSHKGQKLRIQPLRRNESLAGNPLHLLLYAACGLWLYASRGARGARAARLYGICLLAAAILFAALIKYQYSISRLQLPLFVLAAPWAAAVVGSWRSARFASVLAAVFMLAALPPTLAGESRPLLGHRSILLRPRASLLYYWGGELREPAGRLATRVRSRGQRSLGLISNGEILEYYLWYELRRHNPEMPRIENLQPDQAISPPLAVPPTIRRPPPVVGMFHISSPPPRLTIRGRSYRRFRQWRPRRFDYAIYLRVAPEGGRR